MNTFMRWAGFVVVLFIAAPLVIVVPMSFSNASSLQFPRRAIGSVIIALISPAWTG